MQHFDMSMCAGKPNLLPVLRPNAVGYCICKLQQFTPLHLKNLPPQSLIAPTPKVNQELTCWHNIGMSRSFGYARILLVLTVYLYCSIYGVHKALSAKNNNVEQIPKVSSQPGDVGTRVRNPGNTNKTVTFSEDGTFKKNRTTSIYVYGTVLFI